MIVLVIVLCWCCVCVGVVIGVVIGIVVGLVCSRNKEAIFIRGHHCQSRSDEYVAEGERATR